jgi:carboxypeptidase C (cathepsin A)
MRYGLATNPALKLLICHGRYDLVTAYFSSERSVSMLRLPDALRKQVSLKQYDGGHMFYAWEKSRKALAVDAGAIVGV